jgi:hypothetical protein
VSQPGVGLESAYSGPRVELRPPVYPSPVFQSNSGHRYIPPPFFSPTWFSSALCTLVVAVNFVLREYRTMTYSPSDVASGRASPGLDVRAGRTPRSGGPRKVLSGTLGYRVVHFWSIRPHGQTTGLRLGSVVMRLICRGGVLVQASATRDLATSM